MLVVAREVELMRWDVKINAISAAAAVAAAAIAAWQAYDAHTSSKDAFQAALTTQRLSVCIRMNASIETAIEASRWASLTVKPYSKNSQFIALVSAIHGFGEEAKLFRQMMPGKESEQILASALELRVRLKDMVADGGDYLSQSDIVDKVNSLATRREKTCDGLFSGA